MGSISAGFARSRNKQTVNSRSGPGFNSTGYSSINGDTINLDPSIRAIQDKGLQDYASIYGDIGNATNQYSDQTNSLRSKYLGNEGAFMQARVNPVLQKFATLRGDTQQNLGLRGLGGSSFADQALTNVDTAAAREEGDARALATNEMSQFEAGLNQQQLQSLNDAATRRAQITGETLEVAKARVAQEMGLFGLATNNQSSGVATGQNWFIQGKGGIGGGTP